MSSACVDRASDWERVVTVELKSETEALDEIVQSLPPFMRVRQIMLPGTNASWLDFEVPTGSDITPAAVCAAWHLLAEMETSAREGMPTAFVRVVPQDERTSLPHEALSRRRDP